MGAGTFLSSRTFWEIRDSCRAGLIPGLSPFPSPLSPQGPQAQYLPTCPKGSPQKLLPWASEMAWWAKGLAAKSGHLSSILRHSGRRGDCLLPLVPYTCAPAGTHGKLVNKCEHQICKHGKGLLP